MNKIVSNIFLLMLIFGIGDDSMARSRFDVRIHFFENPIPEKVYEDSKNIKSRAYDPESFFLAKIQVVGSPLGESGNKEILVKVIEVLSGKVPAEQFIVRYFEGPPYFAGLPSNHEEGKFYFIMGIVFEQDKIHLLNASVGQLLKSGYLKD